ncbi:MAG: hypothetical protein JXB10_19635 [Pirellulales bacterium]|nr:hypothetical protein [Pirellulales bacterium]
MWKKVVAPVFLVVLLWVVIGGLTTFYINWLYESYAKSLQENVGSIQAAGAMQHTLWRLQSAVLEAVKNPTPENWSVVEKLETLFQKNLSDAGKVAFTEEEKNIILSIRLGFQKYVAQVEVFKKKEEALGRGFQLEPGELTFLAQTVTEPCNTLLEHNKELLAGATASRSRRVGYFNVIRLVFLTAGPLIGILFGVWVARGLHRSISQIRVVLQDASDELEPEVGRMEILPADDLAGVQRQLEAVSGHITQVVEQLQESRREAIRAERLAAVGELAAGVAHELRNPLTSVKLLVQTAAQRRPGQPLPEKQLRVLQEEVARMETTIQGLLDFARPPALRRVRHDLRETVRRAVNLVEGRAKQQQVVVLEFVPDLPVFIDGDPELLHQVFVNLLLNGVDAMAEGGELRVSVEASPGERSCRVGVSDSGAGVPPEILARIFEPFVTTKQRGTGLGLAVSRRIVKQHRGDLKAANRRGGGAVFTVELPFSSETTDAQTPDH